MVENVLRLYSDEARACGRDIHGAHTRGLRCQRQARSKRHGSGMPAYARNERAARDGDKVRGGRAQALCCAALGRRNANGVAGTAAVDREKTLYARRRRGDWR